MLQGNCRAYFWMIFKQGNCATYYLSETKAEGAKSSGSTRVPRVVFGVAPKTSVLKHLRTKEVWARRPNRHAGRARSPNGKCCRPDGAGEFLFWVSPKMSRLRR